MVGIIPVVAGDVVAKVGALFVAKLAVGGLSLQKSINLSLLRFRDEI